MRPAVARLLREGREALIGAAVALGALWMALATFGVTRWVAGAVLLLGLWLLWTGLQRMRFAPAAERDGGPGIVAVDEGRLVYMGPLTGGTLDLAELRALELDRDARPHHWLLLDASGQSLAIPVNAAGAEALFDVFAALPSLDVEAMLAARRAQGRGRVTIWRRTGAPPALAAAPRIGAPD